MAKKYLLVAPKEVRGFNGNDEFGNCTWWSIAKLINLFSHVLLVILDFSFLRDGPAPHLENGKCSDR